MSETDDAQHEDKVIIGVSLPDRHSLGLNSAAVLVHVKADMSGVLLTTVRYVLIGIDRQWIKYETKMFIYCTFEHFEQIKGLPFTRLYPRFITSDISSREYQRRAAEVVLIWSGEDVENNALGACLSGTSVICVTNADPEFEEVGFTEYFSDDALSLYAVC